MLADNLWSMSGEHLPGWFGALQYQLTDASPCGTVLKMANNDGNENDRGHLTVTGRHSEIPKPHVGIDETGDEVIIIVTQAFGPKGDSLVGISDVTFDGHPAVSVGVRANGKEGLVHLSPIHGDKRREGFQDVPDGTKCELFCPVSKEPLPVMGEAGEGGEAQYCGIFLTEKLDQGQVVMVSNVWGHYHSRIIDDMELISYWAEKHG